MTTGGIYSAAFENIRALKSEDNIKANILVTQPRVFEWLGDFRWQQLDQTNNFYRQPNIAF